MVETIVIGAIAAVLFVAGIVVLRRGIWTALGFQSYDRTSPGIAVDLTTGKIIPQSGRFFPTGTKDEGA